ncbi:MAG: PriCT-2 domain-containing protein [Selenomonadaceae bacterium]|nr:PriCT-2 domain-containing protein [Selenomonadaceae bacterium]
MVTDKKSGQIKGCFPLKSKNLGTGWIALYQNPAGWLAQQRLTGEQYSVLFALFNRLDFENFLRISRQEIADFLSMQPVNVSRAMKKLKELGIIIEGPPAGKFKTYRLNPFIAHKGSDRRDTVKDFNSALESAPRKRSLPAIKISRKYTPHEFNDDPDLKEFRIKRMLEHINVCKGEYEKWIGVDFALYSEGMFCSDWNSWSNTQPEYKPGECDKKWQHFGA